MLTGGNDIAVGSDGEVERTQFGILDQPRGLRRCAWTEREDPSWREAVQLSPQQRQDRQQLAAEIIEQLVREKRRGRDA